jgi:hypothetical protein
MNRPRREMRLASIGSGLVLWAVIAGLAACASLHRKAPAKPTPTPGARSVPEFAAAIESDSSRSDRESDPKAREALAGEASADADACLALDPHAAACLYGHAIALGLEARLHPIRANQLLTNMLESLASAEAADPKYDHAGPARVRALVLMRAPIWPLGPGDADAGLVAAQRAVALEPSFPPNLLALAEAFGKTGDANSSRENYARARAAALSLPASPERDSWLREANQALQTK